MDAQDGGDVVKANAHLSLPDRVTHKQWKVREDAYKELGSKFVSAAEDNRIYPDFAPLLTKIVRDPNAPAQLLGLEAVGKFADRAPPALVRSVANPVGKAVAEKALTGRQTNKARAAECVLLFVGGDAGEPCVDALVAVGFAHKTPRVVATAVDVVRDAVVTYGAGAIAVKTVATGLGPLFKHSNEEVRKAAKALLVELHRWVGDGMRSVAKNAPDVTIKELDMAFSANAALSKAKACKLTRAMEERVRTAPEGDNDEGDDPFADEGDDGDEDMNFAEEIDLLPRLPKMKINVEGEDEPVKDWFAAVTSKKWRVRKDSIAWAVTEIADSRLTPGPYGDVVSRLRKIFVKDSNVNVIAQAAKLVCSLASGLRSNLPHPAAKALTVDILFRMKEKNKIATVPMAEALDALHVRGCISIADLKEDIVNAAGGKVPKARAELFLWLDRSFAAGTRAADLKGAPLKTFGNVLTAATEDSTPDVRDAAIGAIASLYVLVGERNCTPYMEKLDKLRTDKVLKIVKDRPPPKRMAPAAGASKASSSIGAKANGKASAVEKGHAAKKGPKTRAATKTSAPKTVAYVSDDEGVTDVPEDDALSRAALRFERFEAEQWTVKSFKARAAAVEVMASGLRDGESISIGDANLIISVLTVAPGLRDSNFMALKAKLELLGLVAEKCQERLPRKTLKLVLEPAVDKLGDIKCAMTASGVFMTVAEATSPRYVFEIVSKGAKETTNARAKIGIAKFASTMVDDFGIPAVSSDCGIDLAAFLLRNPPAALRTAALSLAANIAIRIQPPGSSRKCLEGKIDGPLLELFDGEVGKHKSEPEAPTRKKRLRPGSMPLSIPGEEWSAAEVGESMQVPSEVVDAGGISKSNLTQCSSGVGPPRRRSKEGVPSSTGVKGKATPNAASRTCPALALKAAAEESLDPDKPISLVDHFGAGSPILKGLRNSDWKARQQALSQIDALLPDTTGGISQNVGVDIMPELCRRFGDSNKNIAAAAYGVAGRIGQAMGAGAIVHAKIILPPTFTSGCVDIKASVRYAAAKCLDLWHEAIGLSPMVPLLAKPLATLNPGFRKEYLTWLVPRLKGDIGSFSASDESLGALVDPCLTCLRDRTAEVRQLAEAALGSIVSSVGFSTVETKVLSMTKSARLQLEPIIAAFRDGGGKADVHPSPRVVAGSRSTSAGRNAVGGRPRPTGAAGPPRRANEADTPPTPRGGLRRVRQANVQPPSAVEPPGVLLQGGAGREARAARKFAGCPVVDDGVEGVVAFVPEEEGTLFHDLADCVAEPLYVKMTAPANRFQLHLDAIDELVLAMGRNPDALVECADVLIRWAVFRIDDCRTPPTMVVKACEFVSSICEILLSSGTLFHDYEACGTIPILVDKAGSNRRVVREGVLAALLSVGDVMEDAKLMAYLVDGMFQTTQARSRLEIASVLPHVIERVCSRNVPIPVGAMTVLARIGFGIDEPAGRAAAACIERVLNHIGEAVWDMIGEVNEEEAEILESRFPQVSVVPALDEVAGTPGRHDRGAHAAIPVPDIQGIRAEDFRLSVAPAPPSAVLSAIGDSMHTPKRADRPHRVNPDLTPALPNRRARAGGAGNFSFISSQKSSRVQSVTDMLASGVRVDQEQGLVCLFDDLAEPESPLLYQCASEVLPLLSRGFRDCVERLEDGTADSREQHLLRQFLNALMAYVSAPSVIRGADQSTVEQLLGDVMDAMIPDEMPDVDDWDRVRRGVNLAVLKLLETCDRNLLFTALLNLLLVELRMGSDPNDRPVAKSQLLVKSVSKVTKRGFKDISVDALLRDMNLFVTSLAPSQGWTNDLSGDDEALRLVRTVVDVLVEETGDAIYDGMSLIPHQAASPLVWYIAKIRPLRDTSAVEMGDLKQPMNQPVGKPMVQLGSEVAAECLQGHVVVRKKEHTGMAASSEGNVLKEADQNDPQDKLTDIFDHMLSSGGKDAGLRRLRAFMLCYPDVDFDPYINKCSIHFQQFIRDGLKKISTESPEVELKPETPKNIQTSEVADNASSVSNRSAGNTESSGQAYLKRLREIQLKYGLPEGGSSGVLEGGERISVSKGSNVEKGNGTLDLSAPGTRDKATALRERMARIRKASLE